MTKDSSPDPEYRSALEFLLGFVDYEQNNRWKYDDDHFTIDHVRALAAAIGNPHERGWFVHVAGTNGKGSVSSMIASALRESGLRTGLYTSPHLVDFRERVRVDGRIIAERDLAESVRRIRPAAESIPGITFFDVWTALAFDHFARSGADASVIEVGMGGRLDSTNIITPAVSVITSVTMDHRGRLGDTTSAIAREKAGIIKPGVPAVSAPQTGDVLAVLEARAAETGSEFILVGRDVEWCVKGGFLDYHGRKWRIEGIALPLPGRFQHENAATALAALETLSRQGYPVTPETAKRGIERVRWPGRLERLAEKPDVIVDGACNISAMEAVADHVAGRAPREKTAAVVAMCRDKDTTEVLGILGAVVSAMVFTGVENPRAMSASDLAAEAPGGVTVAVEPDPSRAVEAARSAVGPDGLVIVAGSLYLVGEMYRIFGIDPG